MHNILVVGGGSIGKRHVRCLLRTNRAKVSVCDTRREVLEALAGTYELQAVFNDFACVDLESFAGVVIATPAHLHIAMSRRVVAARVHLLCEKPLCVTGEGVTELMREAQASGVVAGVAFTYRYMPGICELKRLLDEGGIGEVRHIAFRVGQHFPFFRPAYREIYFADLQTGGGAILDAASHLVSAIQWLGGAIDKVGGSYANLGLPEVGVEDTVDAVLKLRNGSMANLHVNMFGRPVQFFLVVLGSQGALRYCGQTGTLGVCRDISGPWEEQSFSIERDDYYVAEAHNFLNAIEGSEQVRCSLQEAVHVNQVCWAIRRSADQDRWVTIV